MNLLETILNFLTTLARIIFPRRKHPVAGDDLCTSPLPEPPIPPLSPSPETPHPEADWLGLSGYTLMLAGGIGSLYKVLVG